MSSWTSEQLTAVDAADELDIATRRPDGTLRDPVTIWVVRDGDELYVRSVNGAGSAWFRGTRDRHAARISAGGVERDVTLEDATGVIDDRLDASYRRKYARYGEQTLLRITSAEARATTLKLVPRP